MLSKDAKFTRAGAFALAEAKRVGDPLKLPATLRTLVLVESAQGVIDNGGLQFFFENDWPGTPPYSVFADAYRAIGADAEGQAINAAAALFPFAGPRKACGRRRKFLDQFIEGGGHRADSPFEPFTDQLCGNERVWSLLKAYVRAHAASFEA